MAQYTNAEKIRDIADKLAGELERNDRRIVFAESCTAGLVSALLAGIPGISQRLCGSAVTYQEQTKISWLDVESGDLENYSAVSDVVTQQMATGVLRETPQADFSAAVTGHLGPDAPDDLDGIGFLAIGQRNGEMIRCLETITFQTQQTERIDRQFEVALFVLETVFETLNESAKVDEA